MAICTLLASSGWFMAISECQLWAILSNRFTVLIRENPRRRIAFHARSRAFSAAGGFGPCFSTGLAQRE
jgi:hypothetical protein